MPTYEYRCRDCGEDLEVQQSFTDDPLTECPSCGGSLKKIFGNVGIAFKGSGFYKNDSRTPGGTGSSGGSSSSSGGSSSGSSGSSDSGSSSAGSGSSSDGGGSNGSATTSGAGSSAGAGATGS